MVAACIETDATGVITKALICVGACSPVARRLPELEAKLIGQPLTLSIAERVGLNDLNILSPIADVRSSADYRLDAALTLVKRALTELANE